MKTNVLPSHFQIGDYCDLILSEGTEKEFPQFLIAGRVTKVHFSESKVMYDLEFTYKIDHSEKFRHMTRIHNVDSVLCFDRDLKRGNVTSLID